MGAIAWVLLGLFGLAVMAVWLAVYQLARQQGWMLLRLEKVEALTSAQPSAADRRSLGLPVSTALPPFRLRDLSGSEIGLEDFRGKQVLLIHWDPQCGFCRQIAPDLAQLQAGLRERNTRPVLVSYRDAESSRTLAAEHGLECQILVEAERETIDAFSMLGTPAAYLLDEEGRVAKPLALGAREVRELAREAVGRSVRPGGRRSLAESRIERHGIARGTQAPTFDLPDLLGKSVALEDYRGRRVLVVFSDPGCGPCNAVAPELARLHRDIGEHGLKVLMVSRGTLKENRRMAAEQGIAFPVVIQRGWRLSKQYGIFETPVAFLVDERGVIAHKVARGGPEIIQLAHEALHAREDVPVAHQSERSPAMAGSAGRIPYHKRA